MTNETAKMMPNAFIDKGNALDKGGTPLFASKQAKAQRKAVETSDAPKKYAQ